MRTLLISLFALFTTLLFSQKNPWERPPAENVWGTQTPSSDSIEVMPIIISNNENLLTSAKNDAVDHYKSGGSFGFGFTAGFLLTITGFLADGVYIIHNSKQEKRIISEIKNDSTYASIDAYELQTKIAQRIKLKKTFATITGTVVGIITQFGVVIGIYILTY